MTQARTLLVRAAVTILAVGVMIHPVIAADPQRPIDKIKAGKGPAEGTTQKIVGGKPAPPGRYPFQVALIRSDTPVGQEHFGQFCGGSLVDARWVVTAAHCVPRTQGKEIDVYIGATVLPSGVPQPAGSQTGIRRHVADQGVFSHQQYAPSTHDNDIALLKLTEAAPSNFLVAKIADPALEQAQARLGDTVTVIGWGATSEGGDTTPTLQEVDVKVQDRAVCEANYQEVVPAATVAANSFCAGVSEGGKDSCQGDSGGFIGVQIKASGSATTTPTFAQLGIVSWGVGCARPKLFGVYTRIAKYHEWIRQIIAQ